MKIRAETSNDRQRVHALNRAAFETTAEADLVDALRSQADPCVSLVAEDAGEIIGHILFTPATLSADQNIFVLALGPMAVIPERQREGVGSGLIHAGLERCRHLGFAAQDATRRRSRHAAIVDQAVADPVVFRNPAGPHVASI